MSNQSPTLPETPPLAQPWEDLNTVLRHAIRAQSAGDLERAHTFFARAVELNPNDSRAWGGLATTAFNLDAAIISWGYTLALSPKNSEARAQLEKHVEEKIGKSTAGDVPVLTALGRALAEVGQKPWALRLLEHATELDPRNEEAWIWRAGVSEDVTEMIACLKRTLEVNPQNLQAQAGLDWALAQPKPESQVNQPEDANDPNALMEKGQRLVEADNKPKAYELFKRATEIDPHNEMAWYWRGSTAADTDEGLDCFERALKINPHNEQVHAAHALLRVQTLRASLKTLHTPAHIAPTESVEEEPAPKLEPKRNINVTVAILGIAMLLALALVAIGALVWLR